MPRSSSPLLDAKRRTAPGMTRRSFIAGLLPAGLLASTALRPQAAMAESDGADLLFNDPDAPTGGNPDGGLTIVNFFDYNCPFCRLSSKPLDDVVREDGDIRLIYKDWPILSEASVTGAVLALAAHRQGGYDRAYHALMSQEERADDAGMRQAVTAAGLDMARLDRDVADARNDIDTLLRRNMEQAAGLGLAGTPGYIVGPFLVTSALNEEGFRQVVADARERMAG
ncbi:MAG: DsbA family protein [Rhizobiaceae bacterium]